MQGFIQLKKMRGEIPPHLQNMGGDFPRIFFRLRRACFGRRHSKSALFRMRFVVQYCFYMSGDKQSFVKQLNRRKVLWLYFSTYYIVWGQRLSTVQEHVTLYDQQFRFYIILQTRAIASSQFSYCQPQASSSYFFIKNPNV